MTRHLCRLTLLAAVLAAASPNASAARRVRLKFATLAPKGTPWMRAFDAAAKEVQKKTDGAVRIRAYPGGVLGEERDVLFKIRAGQIDGAGFLSAGVVQLCPDILAMMTPLTFENYDEVDAVFARMRPHFDAQVRQNGYVTLGWTEVGFIYLFSTVPVRSLADLRKAKPWIIPGDATMRELFRAGKITGVPVPLADVLPGLQTGLIRTVYAPPQAAVGMQWFTRVKYRNTMRLLYSVGGMFVSEKSWQKVPREHQAVLRSVFDKHMTALTAVVRKQDAEALRVFTKHGIQTLDYSPEALREFQRISEAATGRLQGKSFSKKGMDMVRRYRDEHRKKAAEAK